MDTLLRNVPGFASMTFTLDGTPTDADAGVTVSVVNDAGSVVVTGAATAVGSGVYRYQVPAQSELDILTLTWSGTFSGSAVQLVSLVKIVDSHIASISEIRAQDSLDDTAKFPTAMVEQARDEAQALFERYCRRRFVPTYARSVLDGNGTDSLSLPNTECISLIDVTVDGSTDSGPFVLSPTGKLWHSASTFAATQPRNVEVRYTYGMRYVPADIKRAFLTYVRYLLLEGYSHLPDRTLSYNADGLFVQMATAGMNRATGLPEVDAVLNSYRQPRKGWVM